MSLEGTIAKALPCRYPRGGCINGKHATNCPAYHRPAVLAALGVEEEG